MLLYKWLYGLLYLTPFKLKLKHLHTFTGVVLFYIIMVMRKLKRDTMPARLKKAKKDLEKLSHDFIRRRDSIDEFVIGGKCFDCGKLTIGREFQCGHWIPSGSGGAILRYHPQNMHGQASSCNCGYNQEFVKINYTRAMSQKYGEKRCTELLALKNRTIKADILFYLKLIELYTQADEKKIIAYLESL